METSHRLATYSCAFLVGLKMRIVDHKADESSRKVEWKQQMGSCHSLATYSGAPGGAQDQPCKLQIMFIEQTSRLQVVSREGADQQGAGEGGGCSVVCEKEQASKQASVMRKGALGALCAWQCGRLEYK
eukprot:1144778-Pelagomonas_calceolata.AAC.1